MTAPERFADSQIPLAPRAPSIHGPIAEGAPPAAQPLSRRKTYIVRPIENGLVEPYSLPRNFVMVGSEGSV